VGLLGGYTTYSAFAVEVVRLAESGAAMTAGAYVVTSVVGGVAAVAAGTLAAHAVLGRPA
jgi:CrcB protein